MRVVPIIYSVPDWSQYIEICQDTLGYSPTRGLDLKGISPKKASSFLKTLDLENKPDAQVNNKYNFVYIGFAISCDRESLIDLCKSGLHIVHKENKRKCLVLVAGTLLQWKTALAESYEEETQEIIECIIKYIKTAGFKEICPPHV